MEPSEAKIEIKERPSTAYEQASANSTALVFAVAIEPVNMTVRFEFRETEDFAALFRNKNSLLSEGFRPTTQAYLLAERSP